MSSEWWASLSTMAEATVLSWNILPQSLKGLFVVTIREPR